MGALSAIVNVYFVATQCVGNAAPIEDSLVNVVIEEEVVLLRRVVTSMTEFSEEAVRIVVFAKIAATSSVSKRKPRLSVLKSFFLLENQVERRISLS